MDTGLFCASWNSTVYIGLPFWFTTDQELIPVATLPVCAKAALIATCGGNTVPASIALASMDASYALGVPSVTLPVATSRVMEWAPLALKPSTS